MCCRGKLLEITEYGQWLLVRLVTNQTMQHVQQGGCKARRRPDRPGRPDSLTFSRVSISEPRFLHDDIRAVPSFKVSKA